MLDHVSIYASDLERSKKFYDEILAPLGYRALMSFPFGVGYGDTKPDLWLMKASGTPYPSHIALVAQSRQAVEKFYQTALAAGGKDNGPPGLREIYHPTYFAAFVVDPDGHNVEAVNHRGTADQKKAAKVVKKKPAPKKSAAIKKKMPAKRAASSKAGKKRR